MPTTRQVWDGLRTVRNQVALRLGADVTAAPKDMRALANANLATVAVLAKVLIDKNVVTGAELQAAANAAASGADGSSWDDEPVNPSTP